MTDPISVGQPGTHYLKKPCYGFGLMIDPENVYGKMYGHGGDGAGFNTWSAIYPEFFGRSIGLTVFCNTSMGGHPFYLVKEILNELKNA